MPESKSDDQAKVRLTTLFRSRRANCFRSVWQGHKFATHKKPSEVAETMKPDTAEGEAEMDEGGSIWDGMSLDLEQQWEDDAIGVFAGPWSRSLGVSV
jgi:hypothetical protein